MLGSTGGNSSDQVVTVPAKDVNDVYQFACSDDFVAAALNKITRSVLMGGLSVRMTEFKREVKLSEEHQNVIHRDWGAATSTLIWHLFVFGYAVVRPVRHTKYPGEWIPHIVPHNKFQLHFIVTSQRQRQYLVEYLDRQYTMMPLADILRQQSQALADAAEKGVEPPPKRSRTIEDTAASVAVAASTNTDTNSLQFQGNENNLGWPMMDGGRGHLIFVMSDPTVEGYLQSPVALVKRNLMMLRGMLDDESYANYWRARPLHVVRVTKNFFGGAGGGGGGTSGRETFGPGMFANGDIQMDQEQFRFQRNEDEQRDFALAQKAAEQGRMLTMADKEAARRDMQSLHSATHYAQPTNPQSVIAPSDAHHIVLGANQDMVNGPVPQLQPQIQTIRDSVLEMAYAILGIVPQVMNPNGSKYKADPVTVMREWDTALQSINQMLIPMLVETYQVAYSQSMSTYVNGMYKQFKVEATRLEDETESTFDPENTAPMTRRQFEALLNRTGQQDVVKSLRRERKRTVKQTISASVEITFSLNYVPRNTLQDLQLLYQLGVISEDTFCRQAGRSAGIAMDEILLTQAEREKERKRRFDEKQQEMEEELKLKAKYTPEKDNTNALGKGSANPPSVASRTPMNSAAKK